MNDVDDRIRRAMRCLADELPVEDANLNVLPLSKTVPRRRRRAVALSSVAAIVVAIFVVTSTRQADRSVRTVDQDGRRCLPGDIYLVGGSSNTNAILYRGSLCPLRFAPVPNITRARGVSGNGDLVVVTFEAGRGVAKVVDGKTEPLPNLDVGPIEGASVAPDGLVAVTTSQPVTGGVATDRLHVYDPKTGTTRPVLADNRFLSRPAWGPGGKIAVYRAPGQKGQLPEITIVDPDRTARHIAFRPAPSLVEHVLWGPSDLIAVSYNAAGLEPVTVLIEPGTGKQQTFRGWQAVAWSPDGKALLVQTPGKSELGLVEAPDFGSPRRIGSISFHIFGAQWLPCTGASSCARVQDSRPPVTGMRQTELEFGEFKRLAREGRILTADVYEKRKVIRGRHVADDGTESDYTTPIEQSTTMEDLLETLLGDGVPVTLHER